MKKMFYTLALIVSSFFLFILDTKASEKNINVNLDLINDNFYNAKNIVDDYISSHSAYSDKYFLMYQKNVYYVFIYKLSQGYSPGFLDTSNYCINFSTISFFKVDMDNNTLVFQTYTSNSCNTFSFSQPLYSSIDILTDNSNNVLNYKAGEYEKSILCDGNNKILSYYDIYQEINASSSNSHDSELSIIQSFYEVSISKISYLAESISSNYIYLSIFGVFILLFVFELIFRRYL